MATTRGPRVALVLSGGGARGAYEVGIIRYLREMLPRRLGHQPDIRVVVGTSVGAINACFLAATAEDPATQARRLVDSWRSLRLDEVVKMSPRSLMQGVRMMLGGAHPSPSPGQFRFGGLLDTSGLERMVLRQIPWRRIRRNIDANHLDAVAVSATQVRTGHTVVFVSGRGNHPPPWSRNPFIRVAWTRVGPRHALASAAIPLLFPAVKIAGHLYTDGGLRQNTPMSPAIRLGAERLIVISLRSLTSGLDPMPVPVPDADPFPTPLYMIGKTLNALLLDHTGYDLDRMDRLNAILEAGRTCYGDEFIELINKELMKRRGAPLRTIDALMIRPSEDIGHIASEMVHADRITVDSRITKRTLRSLARQEADDESDAVSYFLFDGSFASALIDLGYRDALAKEDELVALLS